MSLALLPTSYLGYPSQCSVKTTQGAELKLQGLQGDRQIITNQGYHQLVCR